MAHKYTTEGRDAGRQQPASSKLDSVDSRKTPCNKVSTVDDSSPLAAWWAEICGRFNPIDVVLGGTYAVHTISYWSTGLALLCFERFFPHIAQRYKTQPGKVIPVPQLVKLFKRVLGNQALLLLGYWAVRKLRPKIIEDQAKEQISRPLPSWKRVVFDYVFNLGVFEVVFYLFHRALHNFRIYRYIHKIHHQFRYPTALASEYAHFVELILSNIIPGAVGPLLTKAHPISTWIWLAGSIIMTNFHHSGLMLPFYPFNFMTMAHDYHHKAFEHQFGVTSAMDKLFKTTGGKDFAEFSREIVTRIAQ